MAKLLFSFLIILFTLNAGGPPQILYSKKSEYGLIEVVTTDTPGLLGVCENGNRNVFHSMFKQGDSTYLGLFYAPLVTPSFCFSKKLQKVLLLGLGAGDFLTYLLNYFPEAQVDAVEINPVMIEIVQKFREPNFKGKAKYFCEDAFKHVNNIKEKYDLIFCDVYFDKPSVSKNYIDFFKKLKNLLNNDGAFIFNSYLPFTSQVVVGELFKTFDNITAQITNDGNNVVFICYQGAVKTQEELQVAAAGLQATHNFRYSLTDLLKKTTFLRPADYEMWINKFPILD